MPKDDLVERLRAGGILNPRMVVAEAKRAGLRLDYACAMLKKESGGGMNVFGHDPTIFVGAGTVTRGKYLEYKRQRVASGNARMQGVGPTQLTYWTLQDRADAQGGCWNPRINMRVGFKHLADHIARYGEADGARRYNGSGPAAVAYSKDLLAKAAQWRAVLDGAAPVDVPVADGPLKLGARGPRVVRLTKRLARLRSKAGTPYLDKPRKRLDATAETALKTFQNEHRLVPDGVFGPLSQRKLNRALRLQEKRKAEKKVPVATPGAEVRKTARRRRTLKSLVIALRRADAETGEAWDELVAHAAKRRRQFARTQAEIAARGPAAETVLVEGFAAVTAALNKIDVTLDGIAEDIDAQSRPEAAQAAATTVATASMTASAGGGGAAPPVVGDGATVTQTAPPAPPPNEGPAPPSPRAAEAPARPRKELVDLTDEELLDRIERMDRLLDRARAVMIRRWIEVEKDLIRTAPVTKEKRVVQKAKAKPAVKPAPNGRPVAKPRQQLTKEAVRELQTRAQRVRRQAPRGAGSADRRRRDRAGDEEAHPPGQALPRLHGDGAQDGDHRRRAAQAPAAPALRPALEPADARPRGAAPPQAAQGGQALARSAKRRRPVRRRARRRVDEAVPRVGARERLEGDARTAAGATPSTPSGSASTSAARPSARAAVRAAARTTWARTSPRGRSTSAIPPRSARS